MEAIKFVSTFDANFPECISFNSQGYIVKELLTGNRVGHVYKKANTAMWLCAVLNKLTKKNIYGVGVVNNDETSAIDVCG